MTRAPNVVVDREALRVLCQRWEIVELAFFGSVMRDDFRPDSDVDIMVAFHQHARISLWDMVQIAHELEELIGRKVDLVEKGAIENPYRLRSMERDLRVIYAAA